MKLSYYNYEMALILLCLKQNLIPSNVARSYILKCNIIVGQNEYFNQDESKTVRSSQSVLG